MTARIAGPVVAGIPLVTEVSEDVAFAPLRRPRWAAEAGATEPLVCRYEVGEIPAELRRTAEGPDVERYFLDEAGGLSYVGHPGGQAPRQWMRTVRAGYEHVVRFESVDDLNDWEWMWKRRLWMHALPVRGHGLALHATLFLLPDGRAVACPGISGAGKSTIARLLQEVGGDRGVRVLSDDRVGLTPRPDGTFEAWSTPWYSNAAISEAGHGPLAALLLLRHGSGASLVPAEGTAISRMLMRTLALPFWSDHLMAEAFGTVDALVAATRWWEFAYAPTTDEAAALIPRLLSALDGT